jgi:hypothetical protein
MHIDPKTKEYLDELKQVRLSDSARTRIEQNLIEYARFHTVREVEDNRFIGQVPQRTALLTLFKPKSMTALIIAIALVAGGGTSFAAEKAVPGDILYSIKTGVNENIRSAFAFSHEAEAKLQARLAQERLEEAETLAARGSLDAQTAARLSSDLKTHYDEASEQNMALDADGDYEASANVRASLEGNFRTYADVLTDLHARIDGNDGGSLIAQIRAYADSTAHAQTQASTTLEASGNVEVSAEATVNEAERVLATVAAKIDGAESQVSAETHARAEARLGEATRVHAEAKASFEAQAYTSAYTSAQTAIRIAREAEASITSALRIEADLNLDAGSLIQIGDDGNESPTSTEEVEVETSTGTGVDTDIIDINIDTDGSLNSGLNLQ